MFSSPFHSLFSSDVDALLGCLKDGVVQDGFTNQFVQVMHYLLTIPAEKTMGEQIWNNVQYIVHRATTVVAEEDGDNERPQMTYEELVLALNEKERLDAQEHQNKIDALEATIEEQRANLHKLEMIKQTEIDEVKSVARAEVELSVKEKFNAEAQRDIFAQQCAKLQSDLSLLQEQVRVTTAQLRAGGAGTFVVSPHLFFFFFFSFPILSLSPSPLSL